MNNNRGLPMSCHIVFIENACINIRFTNFEAWVGNGSYDATLTIKDAKILCSMLDRYLVRGFFKNYNRLVHGTQSYIETRTGGRTCSVHLPSRSFWGYLVEMPVLLDEIKRVLK